MNLERSRENERRGQDEAGGLSHREIAKRLGISPARVQQIEAQALRKLAKLAKGWQ
jgi:DNA-directed RNA polymerase sigma subunit (sigma70/sigma32)